MIAHEIGHHVQNLLGTEARVRRRSGATRAARTRCRCGSSCRPTATPASGATRATGRAAQRLELEPGDVEEALRAAAAIGDDRLQQHRHRPRDARDVHARLVGAARDVVPPRLRQRRPAGGATDVFRTLKLLNARRLLDPLYTGALRIATRGRGLAGGIDDHTTLRIDPRCRWIRDPATRPRSSLTCARASVRPLLHRRRRARRVLRAADGDVDRAWRPRRRLRTESHRAPRSRSESRTQSPGLDRDRRARRGRLRARHRGTLPRRRRQRAQPSRLPESRQPEPVAAARRTSSRSTTIARSTRSRRTGS